MTSTHSECGLITALIGSYARLVALLDQLSDEDDILAPLINGYLRTKAYTAYILARDVDVFSAAVAYNAYTKWKKRLVENGEIDWGWIPEPVQPK